MGRITFLFTLSLLTCVSQANAHVYRSENGASMSYPKECCGREDCGPVVKTERVGAGVWLHLADGTHHLITPQDKRRLSEDGEWHLCTRTDHEAQTKVVTCVFEPAIN